jgi:hypothetical protein
VGCRFGGELEIGDGSGTGMGAQYVFKSFLEREKQQLGLSVA